MIHLRSIISDRDMEIFFRIANGDSYRDIARDIGISTDALAMRIHRLRRHISDQIRDAV
jgi:DNA-binding CsgD family transcriptional regulator